jgi:hypothetical protein
MLIIRICHLATLPDLKNVLLNIHENSNNNFIKENLSNNQNNLINSDNQNIDQNSELVLQILKSFEGSKLI